MTAAQQSHNPRYVSIRKALFLSATLRERFFPNTFLSVSILPPNNYFKKKENQGFHVSSTPKACPQLTVYMVQQKVSFPAVYCIQSMEDVPDQWVCTIINNTDTYLTKEIQKLAEVDIFSARSSDFMETLLSLYKPKLKKICQSTAKAIPSDDRYQLAQEGFIDAALHYNPNLHIFPDYALFHAKKYLQSQIGQYSGSYTEYYALEKTLPDGTCYNTNSDPLALESFDLVINDVILKQSLTSLEYEVCQKITEGYKEHEILDMYQISSTEYSDILDTIRTSLSPDIQS